MLQIKEGQQPEELKITQLGNKRVQQRLKGAAAAQDCAEENAAFQIQESEEGGQPTSVTTCYTLFLYVFSTNQW